MQMQGGDHLTCPECGTVFIKATKKEASYIRTDDDKWIRTYPPPKDDKPFTVPTRPHLPSYLTEGIALGTGMTVILGRLGLNLPAGAWASVWVGAVSFSTYAALSLERWRARRPRTRKERTTVRVSVEGERDTAKENLNFDCSIKALRTFASQVDAVANTSETAWTGSGKPFSRPEYYTLRDELIKAGFGRWKNERHHAQGWNLTAKGKALMRGLAPTPRS